jgi:hypothetical protein
MTAKSATTLLMVDNETGVRAMVEAIEKEKGRAVVPRCRGRRDADHASVAAEVHEAFRLARETNRRGSMFSQLGQWNPIAMMVKLTKKTPVLFAGAVGAALAFSPLATATPVPPPPRA